MSNVGMELDAKAKHIATPGSEPGARSRTTAKVFLDTRRTVGPLDRRIFSGFVEHIGRVVYGGIYDPSSQHADELGYRTDVLDLLRPLRMPAMRYPGGNFVSNYDWRDGIGPRNERKARPDFAWKSVEPNQFGVDEFVEWCRRVESSPLMVVNLGTGDAKNAAELVEYCNLPGGSYWADQRIANGAEKPHNIRLWGLGNEMDGPWQAGHCSAEEYAGRAYQAAQLMKGLDPSIELVLSGSTIPAMPTYMQWDQTVLHECWDYVEYISAHHYSRNPEANTREFLAEGVAIDTMLEDYRALIRFVQARKKSKKQIFVAFDEWNVWYREKEGTKDWWRQAPALLEEQYNLEDALVVAQYISSFIRHADVVKIACIAQVVNVIAPILTRQDDVLVQSIYYPFLMMSQAAKGLALNALVDARTYDAGKRGQAPLLDASATFDPESGEVGVFLVNRDVDRATEIDIELQGTRVSRILDVQQLSGTDPNAANTWERRDVVKPHEGKATIRNGRVHVEAPAMALVTLRLQLDGATEA